MKEWRRTSHDRVVRQIAASGAPERGRLLLELFDHMDALIRPLAVDEIGMSGETVRGHAPGAPGRRRYSRRTHRLFAAQSHRGSGPAAHRGAEAVLRKVAEARKVFGWASPGELRLVAAQAMEKIDPDWVRSFMPRSGLSIAESGRSNHSIPTRNLRRSASVVTRDCGWSIRWLLRPRT